MKTNPWPNRYFTLGVIALVGVLAYSNTFTVPFQFDDDAYVANNPAIRSFRSFLHPTEIASVNTLSPTGIPAALRSAFMTRILGYLSLAINYHFHGLKVTGYHAVNLLIHILNAWLIYFILRQTFKYGSPRNLKSPDKTPDMAAFIGALLFLCHPVQTHAVTYITSRFVLLASFFSLSSLVAYIHFRFAEIGWKRYGFMVLSFLSAAAAMFTKEFTFTFPFIIALYDFSFIPGTLRQRLRSLAPLAFTLPIIPVLVLIQQGNLGTLDSTMRTITAADVSQISRLDYLFTQFGVIILYLRLLVFPVNQNIDHDIPVLNSLWAPTALLSLLFLLALIVFAGYGYRRSIRSNRFPEIRIACFGIFWFFIALSVESSIIPLGELSAEYRLYLPSVGIVIAFISLAAALIRRYPLNRKISYGCAAALVVLFCTMTLFRNRVWGSEIALWEDAARKSPAKLRPLQNLGLYYSMQGRLAEAEEQLQKAIRIDPRNYELHNNLGIVFRKQGDLAGAIREYSIALQLQPADPMAHYNIGNIYLAQANLEGAMREYEACIRLAPDYDEAHNNLGIVYERIGKIDAAIMEFKRAISLNPESLKARNNLELCLKKAASLRKNGSGGQ